jgi:hypothetical protein
MQLIAVGFMLPIVAGSRSDAECMKTEAQHIGADY